MIFELSNETWNWIFAPWTFDSMTDAATGRTYLSSEVYGLFQEYVVRVLQSSPYWSPAVQAKVGLSFSFSL